MDDLTEEDKLKLMGEFAEKNEITLKLSNDKEVKLTKEFIDIIWLPLGKFGLARGRTNRKFEVFDFQFSVGDGGSATAYCVY